MENTVGTCAVGQQAKMSSEQDLREMTVVSWILQPTRVVPNNIGVSEVW